MNEQPQTVRAEARPSEARAGRDALLVHIYPTGPEMGSRYLLGDRPLVIGRGENCDIRINDSSVSRRHASVQPADGGHVVVDLKSTNGTFLNDVAVAEGRLEDGDYLRVGNRLYRFLAGGNVEADYHEEIYRLTIIDALTDVHNKRYLLEFLDRELARSRRHRRPLSLVLFDLDHFKKVNDELGHLAGDYTLRELAARVRRTVREGDLLARYGGEEFAVVLPETTPEVAVALAERVRAQAAAHAFEFDGDRYAVTVSLGVATTVGDECPSTLELVRRADEALYRAKGGGRNRVAAYASNEAADPPTRPIPVSE